MSDEDWDNEVPSSSNKDYEARASRSYYSQQSRSSYEKNNYDENNERDRSFRSERSHYEHIECVDIRSNQIGKIIGRAGANIKRLQSDFDVHMDIDKSSNVVKVSGNSSSQVRNAIDAIKSQLDEGGSDNRRQGGASRGYQREERNYGRDNYERNSERENNERNDYNKRETTENSSNAWGTSSSSYGSSFDESRPITAEGLIDWDKLNKRSDEIRKIRWAKCPPLTKNFYHEAPEVAKLSSQQIEKIREENNNITVSRVFAKEDAPADDIPNPIWKFEQCFADYPDLMDELKKMNFEKPSPIQSQAWPVLMKGEDLIGIAQTGTGKTLAFLLPGMIHTDGQSTPRGERGGPNVLILAPTRELALQIEKEVNKYSFRNMKA